MRAGPRQSDVRHEGDGDRGSAPATHRRRWQTRRFQNPFTRGRIVGRTARAVPIASPWQASEFSDARKRRIRVFPLLRPLLQRKQVVLATDKKRAVGNRRRGHDVVVCIVDVQRTLWCSVILVEDYLLFGRNMPSATNSARKLNKNEPFILRTAMVVRPTGVRPTKCTPIQRKCFDHR